MLPQSLSEQLLINDLVLLGYPPVLGFAFHEWRGWEFDLAYPMVKLAVEVDGRGRHQTVGGYAQDCEKLNAAIESGWRVLRYPASYITRANRRANICEQIMRIVCQAECETASGSVLFD